ncbi:MAG TPA: hypothetical protein VKW78_00760 [Terriglobales bacterium]|nr:hypothetical protein [Terriglobales bacterium]
MVSKCANPLCSASFRYFREGRLFEIEVMARRSTPDSTTARKPHRKVEYFWLCPDCAREWTVRLDGDRGVVTVPIAGTAARHATA